MCGSAMRRPGFAGGRTGASACGGAVEGAGLITPTLAGAPVAAQAASSGGKASAARTWSRRNRDPERMSAFFIALALLRAGGGRSAGWDWASAMAAAGRGCQLARGGAPR